MVHRHRQQRVVGCLRTNVVRTSSSCARSNGRAASSIERGARGGLDVVVCVRSGRRDAARASRAAARPARAGRRRCESVFVATRGGGRSPPTHVEGQRHRRDERIRIVVFRLKSDDSGASSFRNQMRSWPSDNGKRNISSSVAYAPVSVVAAERGRARRSHFHGAPPRRCPESRAGSPEERQVFRMARGRMSVHISSMYAETLARCARHRRASPPRRRLSVGAPDRVLLVVVDDDLVQQILRVFVRS